MKLNVMARIAVAAALAAGLELYGGFKIPVLFPSFLKIDLGDLLPLVVGQAMGFQAGVWTEVVKTLLHMLIKGGNLVGNSANLVAGVAFLLPLAFQTARSWGGRSALVLAILGPVTAGLVMIPANWLVYLPFHGTTGMPALVMSATTLFPFNLVKFGFSSALAYFMMPTVTRYLASGAPLPQDGAKGQAD
jgi:riboflavin transporter